jgi:hypothetical protein
MVAKMKKPRGVLGLVSKRRRVEEQEEEWNPVYPFIQTPFNYHYIWDALLNLYCWKREKEKPGAGARCIKYEDKKMMQYLRSTNWKWFPDRMKRYYKTLYKIVQLVKDYHKTDLEETVASLNTGSLYVIVYPGFIYHFRGKDLDYYHDTNDGEYIMNIIKEETSLIMGREDGLKEVLGPLETKWFPVQIGYYELKFKARARMLIGQYQPRLGYYIILELTREDGRNYKAWRRFNEWSYTYRKLWTESDAFISVIDDFFEKEK